MTVAHLNRIATAVPAFDVHAKFVAYAPELLADDRSRRLFRRMAERAQIDHRYSFVEPDPSPRQLDRCGLFTRGAFADTAARMRFFADHAFALAEEAVHSLGDALRPQAVTHLIVTTCTGFYAPGLDLQIVDRFGLRPGVERTMIGFMGCQAALPGLKLARHIVRSQPAARVLMVNLELCTLHLQETSDLQSVLSFLIFADGCAASIVSAEPAGLELHGFGTALLPDSRAQITWRIAEQGFLMWLDGAVPGDHRPRPARGRPRAARRARPGRGRAVGDPSGRADHPRRGPGGPAAGGGRARRFARRPARLRQHELGHGDVRARAHAGAGRTGAAGLRPGVRARPDRRGHALSHPRRRMSWDVAVAGGGLAGAAAAARLAAAGRRVVVFERERGPHDKVCGEFLSGEAAGELAELGLAPATLGAAPIGALRLAAGRATARRACRSRPGACRDGVSTSGCWTPRPRAARRSGAVSRCGHWSSTARACGS